MARKVYAVDIGSYSSKRVILKAPLVGFSVSGAREEIHASALDPKTRRSDLVKNTREILPEGKLSGEAVTALVPSEGVLHRVVDLPFSDRSKIQGVLPFELESHVPLSADEMAFDWMVLESGKGKVKLFTSVLPNQELQDVRELMESMNLDPRFIAEESVANAKLYMLLSERPSGTVAFVNLGHRKTVVTLASSEGFVACRVTMFGGLDLTRALVESLSVSLEEAERLKQDAHLFPAGEGLTVGRPQEVADALKQALSPLVRDLHQMFRQHGPIAGVWLFGGTARLAGLHQYFAQRLGIQEVQVLFPSLLKVSAEGLGEHPEYVPLIAGGYVAVRGRDHQRINFRTGFYAYEGDFKYVRGRLTYLLVASLLMMAVFLVPGFVRVGALERQKEQMDEELQVLAQQIFGETIEDYQEILGRLDEVPSAEVWTVFPDLSAHEIFWEVMDVLDRVDGQPTGETRVVGDGEKPGADADPLSAGLPGELGADGLPVLDGEIALGGGIPDWSSVEGEASGGTLVDVVHSLEMNSMRVDSESRTTAGDGSVEFTGNASSVATMELFIERLSQHACFHNVQKTKQEMLKATAGKEGWWRFTVDFSVSCPKKALEGIRKDRDSKDAAPAEATGGGEEDEAPPTPTPTPLRSSSFEGQAVREGPVPQRPTPAPTPTPTPLRSSSFEGQAVREGPVREGPVREGPVREGPALKEVPTSEGASPILQRSLPVRPGAVRPAGGLQKIPVGAGTVPRRPFMNRPSTLNGPGEE